MKLSYLFKEDIVSDTFYISSVLEANEYGIRVVGDTFTPAKLKNDERAIIVKEDGEIIIYVSTCDTLEEQRFAIAHALGHYVCGHLNENKTVFRDGNKEYSEDNYDSQECEANNYAADLLMPVEKIEFLMNNKGYNKIEDLASALIVSYSDMSTRLKDLGWIS